MTNVRNDVTGEWKKALTTANINMPENAIAYYEEYMEENDLHYVISFGTNTTTLIHSLNGHIYIDVTEYVEGEEFSADTLGSGMWYVSYDVNIATGKITELDY